MKPLSGSAGRDSTVRLRRVSSTGAPARIQENPYPCKIEFVSGKEIAAYQLLILTCPCNQLQYICLVSLLKIQVIRCKI